ncbi:MAG TPA: hypothetical protein VK540_28825 [Polyangiaceae bacterium]|nr:hypothetical protein [Polyangiaceae bacterium]
MKPSLFVAILAAWWPLLALAGCAQKMAPPPYTAEQIRAANPPGTVYRYKVETAGQPMQIRVMEFTSGGSAEKAEVRNRLLDEGGRETTPPSVDRAAWDELRRHGEFPQSALTVHPGTIEVPAGKFEVMVYTVQAPDGDTMRFYFANGYAGPPVLFYKERAGVRLMTSTLIERKSGG